GLSLLNHTFACAGILCLAQGLTFTTNGQPVPLPVLPALIVLPLGLFLNTFGMAGGFGAGEAAFEGLFQLILNVKGGTALALIFHVVGVLYRLLGWPFWFFYKKKAHITE